MPCSKDPKLMTALQEQYKKTYTPMKGNTTALGTEGLLDYWKGMKHLKFVEAENDFFLKRCPGRGANLGSF